jgi:hypothetical protein
MYIAIDEYKSYLPDQSELKNVNAMKYRIQHSCIDVFLI